MYLASYVHLLISQLSIKKRLREQTLGPRRSPVAFTRLLDPFDLCFEKFEANATLRMKRGGGRRKKRIVYKESSVELCPLGHRVFACAVTKLERERERDVGINISLIFPREEIPGKTRLEPCARGGVDVFNVEDGRRWRTRRGKKKKRRRRRRRREKKGRRRRGLVGWRRERERECSVVRPMDRRKKEFLVWTSPTGRAGGS